MFAAWAVDEKCWSTTNPVCSKPWIAWSIRRRAATPCLPYAGPAKALATSTGGRGEVDALTGGNGNDLFVLSTAAGYLCSDGKSNSVGITDFTSGSDKLQLVGSAVNHYLGVRSVAELTAHQRFFRELGATDELIAILQESPIAALDNATVNWV